MTVRNDVLDRHMEERLGELIHQARLSRTRARAPFSGYRVGAALLSETGGMYRGCNVEFANYSNTLHAEEVAIARAVGCLKYDMIAIAVCVDDKHPQFPCGMCRQSLFELYGPDLLVIAVNGDSEERATMGELLPHGFRLEKPVDPPAGGEEG